jgi:threonine dehydrogenase-like Zn-dependent dehydrogenase
VKAVRIDGPGKSSLVELELPEPVDGEVRLKIRYVGFCGSDLGTYLGSNPNVQYPRIPGHEISAIIEKTGRGVPDRFVPGQEVTAIPYTSCGQCPSCRQGRSHACQFNQTLGVQRDGAMQEYLTIPWQKIIQAPGLSSIELALVEPLTVGFHAADRGKIQKGDLTMVLGCGMIGAGAITGSSGKGATVIAVDIDEFKLKLAEKLGAKYTLNSLDPDFSGKLKEITQGEGPGVVIEAAGNPVTYRVAIEEVAFAGRVVCIGYANSDVNLSTNLFVKKELEIMGSRNAAQENFEEVIRYLKEGTFPLDSVVSRIVPAKEAGKVLKEWAMNPGKMMKILVDWS